MLRPIESIPKNFQPFQPALADRLTLRGRPVRTCLPWLDRRLQVRAIPARRGEASCTSLEVRTRPCRPTRECGCMRVAIQATLELSSERQLSGCSVSASQPPRANEHLSARLAPSDISSCVVLHLEAFCAENSCRCSTTNGFSEVPCSTPAVPPAPDAQSAIAPADA